MNETKRKLFIKIMAIALAALMASGTIIGAIVLLIG